MERRQTVKLMLTDKEYEKYAAVYTGAFSANMKSGAFAKTLIIAEFQKTLSDGTITIYPADGLERTHALYTAFRYQPYREMVEYSRKLHITFQSLAVTLLMNRLDRIHRKECIL